MKKLFLSELKSGVAKQKDQHLLVSLSVSNLQKKLDKITKENIGYTSYTDPIEVYLEPADFRELKSRYLISYVDILFPDEISNIKFYKLCQFN